MNNNINIENKSKVAMYDRISTFFPLSDLVALKDFVSVYQSRSSEYKLFIDEKPWGQYCSVANGNAETSSAPYDGVVKLSVRGYESTSSMGMGDVVAYQDEHRLFVDALFKRTELRPVEAKLLLQ